MLSETSSAQPEFAVPLIVRSKSPGEGSFGEPTETVHRSATELRQLSAQVEAFLMRQLERLEQELGDAAQLQQRVSETDGEYSADLETAKSLWESQRADELARIQDDSRRLAEAWERLEDEQRELLRQRAMQQASGGANGTSSKKSVAVAVGSDRSRSSNGSSTPATVQRSAPAAAGHKNQLQFQQLRREMLEHARQRRKR